MGARQLSYYKEEAKIFEVFSKKETPKKFFSASKSTLDYYPFGMQMPGRNGMISGGEYRYAFNGMETDKEVSGTGNSYTTQFRQYDPRLGRWKSIDPLAAKYASVSPYVGMGNNPNFFTDPLGLEPEGGGDETLPNPETAEEGDVVITEKKDTDGKTLSYTKWVLTGGEWKPVDGLSAPVEVKSGSPAPSDESNNATTKEGVTFKQALKYWYDNTAFGRFDNWMKSIPDPDMKGDTKKGTFQGNGEDTNLEGGQHENGEDGQGSPFRSKYFEKDGMKIYIDVSYMPGTIMSGGGGAQYRGSVKVKVKIKLYNGQTKTIKMNTKTKLDIDDIDDLFDTDGGEIFNNMANLANTLVDAFQSDDDSNSSGTSPTNVSKPAIVIQHESGSYKYVDGNWHHRVVMVKDSMYTPVNENQVPIEVLNQINK